MRRVRPWPFLVLAALMACGARNGAPVNPQTGPAPAPAPAPASNAEGWTDLGDGTATDPALTWQTSRSDAPLKWAAAKAYCDGLDLAGGGWRLPTISELRTLIRGCEGTVTSGACGATADCTARSCRSGACYACREGEGPTDGCYGRPELSGPCDSYWSSSEVSDDPGAVWFVSFNDGHVYSYGAGNSYYARCVRPLPR